MSLVHFYWGIRATPAMSSGQFNALDQRLQSRMSWVNDNRQDALQMRYNVAGDGVIYEAEFDDTTVTFEQIRQHVVALLSVADGRVTVTTSTQTFGTRVSAIGAFRLDGIIMFRATIFGRNSDSQAVTWEQSRLECVAFLAANQLIWDEP